MESRENFDLEVLLKERNLKEKQATKKSLIIIGLIIILCIAWFVFTYYQVNLLQKKKDDLSKETSKQRDSLTLIKNLRDSFRLEYLEAKGFDKTKGGGLLEESIKANNLLSQLLEHNKTNSTVKIKYYRKTLDQQKVWLSLKELGYKNIEEATSTNPVLLNAETNTIATGEEVPLIDIKIIALTLIRGGFKVHHSLQVDQGLSASRHGYFLHSSIWLLLPYNLFFQI